MRAFLRAAALLAPLVLLAGPAGAQAPADIPEPTIQVSAEPARLELEPGHSDVLVVSLTNTLDREVVLTLRASAMGEKATPGQARVTFEHEKVTLPPGGAQRVSAKVAVPADATPAEESVFVGAEEAPRAAAADARADYVYGMAEVPLAIVAPQAKEPTPKETVPRETEPEAPVKEAEPETVEAAAQPVVQETPSPSLPVEAWALAAAAGAAGAGAAGFAWLRRRWGSLAGLLAPLYTRIARNRVLDQPTRERIAALVQAEPGLTFGELQRRLGVGAGTLTHHARMLEKAGVLFSSPDGQTRRFFHVAQGRRDPVPPLAERALDALARDGPMTPAELARALGVSKQALHYHVKRLVAEGTLVARGEGRGATVALPEPPSRDVGLPRAGA